MLQLAGHLRGRALQEWNLLSEAQQTTYKKAVEALRARLDSGNRTLAVQDFRHSNQKETEPVADFIRRLEHTYQLAYGHDRMHPETRDTLLCSQLKDGLLPDFMKAPVVSGAGNYQELCIAAKNEENRQAIIRRSSNTGGLT